MDSIQEQEKSRKHVLSLGSGKSTTPQSTTPNLVNLDRHQTSYVQKQMLNISDMLEYMHDGERVNDPN